MVDCMILGDSIAAELSVYRKECVAYVKPNANSYNWNNVYITKNLTANTVIISLGGNDRYNVNTFRELMTLRQLVAAKKVFWIMPAAGVNLSEIQDCIKIIANAHGDTVLHMLLDQKSKIVYKNLADATKNK